MTADDKPRPRAFRLDDASHADGRVIVEPQPDIFDLAPEETAIEAAQTRGVRARTALSWSGLFWSSLGALASLAIGVWLDGLIESFFARSPLLGWSGVALLACAALALLALLTRELMGLLCQRQIARLHMALTDAHASDDRDAARALVGDLAGLYAGRPATARARAHLDQLTREIIDGRDLIEIAERELMPALDDEARREIAGAAKRVSVVTTISPRALVDMLFVGAQAVRLIRRLSEIYGGRPGLIGFLRLLRSVGAHLAITGGMAMGDSLVQQALGHGVAARLSARLGEGVLNGLLTARIGLCAMAVCRPMPFAARKAPGVMDVAPFLFGGKKEGG